MCGFCCENYLKAVVIMSALTLDSRESNVTLHSTYVKKGRGRGLSGLFTVKNTNANKHQSNISIKFGAQWCSSFNKMYLSYSACTCVCPLWNRAEPCSGLKRSTSQEMFLKAVSCLPSHLQHVQLKRNPVAKASSCVMRIYIHAVLTSCTH